MFVAKCTTSFWRKGLRAPKLHRYVDYMGEQNVVSVHPGFTSVATNVPCLSVDAGDFGYRLSENGGRQME